MPPQAKPVGWGETIPPNQWSAAPGAKPKTTGGWDEASWAMAQRAKVCSIFVVFPSDTLDYHFCLCKLIFVG